MDNLSKGLDQLIHEEAMAAESHVKQNRDDDLVSNADIDEFERKLKNIRHGANDSDSDDDLPAFKNKQTGKSNDYGNKASGATSVYNERDAERAFQPNKMEKIQNDLYNTKQNAIPKTEDQVINDIIISKNATAKDKKLKELLQKNRELNVQYEKEKTFRQKYEKELAQIKKDIAETGPTKGASSATKQSTSSYGSGYKKPSETTSIANDDQQDWKKKFQEMDKKVQEFRVQNQSLKNEVNKAMRVISRECGENVDIDKILTEENSWKGRQQQIEVLKSRLKEAQGRNNDSQITDINMSTNRFVGAGQGKAEDRRRELDNLKEENEKLKGELESLQTKVKGTGSRKTVLETELKSVKEEYDKNKRILLEKSENDDRYIEALKTEISKLKNTPAQVQTKVVFKEKADNVNESSKDNQDIRYLVAEVEKKDKLIKELLSERVKSDVNRIAAPQMQASNNEDKEKIGRLEMILQKLRSENEALATMKGFKSGDHDARIVKDLSVQNAQMRKKIEDLETKLDAKNLAAKKK